MRSVPLAKYLVALLLVVPLTGCGGSAEEKEATRAPEPASGAAPWPAPNDPLGRAVDAGLEPETHEFLDFHVHAHLDVFVNGEPVEVPGGIGINIEDPGVKTLEGSTGVAYGGIDPPCDEPCISPLHTHEADGVLHTESAENEPNRLGQFFIEWGVALSSTCVGGYCEPEAPIQVFVDGEPFQGDPAEIRLVDGLEIAIVIGSPPEDVPSEFPGN